MQDVINEVAMKTIFTALFFSVLSFSPSLAQKINSRYFSGVVRNYTDSLRALKSACMQPQQLKDSLDVTISPYLFPIIGPATYQSGATHRMFSFFQQDDATVSFSSRGMKERDNFLLLTDRTLIMLYQTTPSAFAYHDGQYEREKLVDDNLAIHQDDIQLNEVISQAQEVTDVSDVTGDVEVNLQVKKPNFWTRNGNFSLQFAQNYVSENWYKGGNNNETLLMGITMEANYNDQKKMQWDNKLDLKLGFVTTTADSCHHFLTNNDKIYLGSKLGVKAAKSWYYTVSAEANTQFMPSYRTNDKKRYGMFLAPLDVYASVGMDFKPSLKNGNTLSAALLPISYKMRYVRTDDEHVHAFLNMKDKNVQKDIGSKIEVNTLFTLAKNFTWKTRFYGFTSYKYTEAELENTINYQFSRYISSQLYTIWRFDDNRSRDFYDDNLGYFQFKEFVTLGLSYAF